MRRIVLLLCLTAALMLTGCATPTPEADLNAAVAALGIVSALPNLTAADKAWINAAADGLSCSALVLSKSEATAQEALDIAACFAGLPVIPSADSVYVSAGIAAVEVFISLFNPAPSPAAVSANVTVRGWSAARKERYVANAKTQLTLVRK